MAVLTSQGRDNLPDTAFGYIEPGGKKVNGKTVPGNKRHFPIHDAAHVRNALARAGQGARFGKEAMPKILAAAKRMGVEHDAASSGTGRSFESMYPEVRFLADVPEIRSIGDSQPHITGYAAAFEKLSRRMGGFVERVMPTAFNEARDAGWQDVVCRYNHKDDMVLGTTGGGTLQLGIDERGLTYDVIPPDHRSDVIELIKRRDVRYSSFAFRCAVPGTDDEWGVSDFGLPLRSLHNVALLDTAPVLDPAYRDTSVVARNMTGAIESLAMWVDAEPAEVRSMLEAGQASRFFRRTDRPSVPAEVAPQARPSPCATGPSSATAPKRPVPRKRRTRPRRSWRTPRKAARCTTPTRCAASTSTGSPACRGQATPATARAAATDGRTGCPARWSRDTAASTSPWPSTTATAPAADGRPCTVTPRARRTRRNPRAVPCPVPRHWSRSWRCASSSRRLTRRCRAPLVLL
jgi:HK97 family phage prohead protease